MTQKIVAEIENRSLNELAESDEIIDSAFDEYASRENFAAACG
jgi:hypothetical protein